jgi:hypothetical protein
MTATAILLGLALIAVPAWRVLNTPIEYDK